jgi:nicotinamide riboside kinase
MGSVSVAVMELARSRRPDVYLLTSDDIPFVQDGLRDGEHIRGRMTTRFREELDKCDVPWCELVGARQQRQSQALDFIAASLGSQWLTA